MLPSGIPTPRALPTDHSRQGLDSKSLAREAVIRLDADPGVRACLKEAASARSPAFEKNAIERFFKQVLSVL